MYTYNKLALALAPLVLVARADVGFDLDDVPNECKAICKPIGQLSDMCDIDLRSDIDRDEDRLQAQCVCTNDSFDVGKVAGLCAACLHQSAAMNKNQDDDDDDKHADQDDLEDINNLMTTCSFSSTSYNPSATAEAQSITVSASKPTDVSQLTTTLGGGGGGGGGGGAMPSGSASQPTGSVMASGTNTDMTSNTMTGRQTSSTGSGSDNNSDMTSASGIQTAASVTPTDNAAPGGMIKAGGSAVGAMYVVGAFVVGGLMMVR